MKDIINENNLGTHELRIEYGPYSQYNVYKTRREYTKCDEYNEKI
jgi:hypothetical protein